MKTSEKIDIVIPWVDGSDPNWQKEKQKYANKEIEEGNHPARFRNWNHLKYVLRSIEKNMPWVNHIYLVTANQRPDWLKPNEKLSLIYHKDFIPKQYLPTFSSHVIELNVHRIPNLSNQFIYFNDDIFAVCPLNETDFFKQGLPCDNAILHIHCVKKSLMIHTIANNDVAVINEHFDMKKLLKKNIFKYFNINYGIKNNLRNLFLIQSPRFPGFRQYHMANSYLKTTFKELWKKEEKFLDKVCQNKFRTINDVNQWVVREWQLVSNNFVPYPKYKMGRMIDFEKDTLEKNLALCEEVLINNTYKMICINDGDSIDNFDKLKEKIEFLLEQKYPDKSSFEK